MTVDARIFSWPNITRDTQEIIGNCTSCLAIGKKLLYQKPKYASGLLNTHTRNSNSFFRGITEQNLNEESQSLLPIDRFGGRPTAKNVRAKEVRKFLTEIFN